jgi:hypothetical protein
VSVVQMDISGFTQLSTQARPHPPAPARQCDRGQARRTAGVTAGNGVGVTADNDWWRQITAEELLGLVNAIFTSTPPSSHLPYASPTVPTRARARARAQVDRCGRRVHLPGVEGGGPAGCGAEAGAPWAGG